jgi:heptose I phosphotransferase
VIHIREDFRKYFIGDKGMKAFMAIDGEVFKEMPGRRTLCFDRFGRKFFIKQHFGVGWQEIFKNLLSLRLPVISALNEQRAIAACENLGIATMNAVAWGEQGINPARRRSFLVTEALQGTETLEDWLPKLMMTPDEHARARLRQAVVSRVATIACNLHEHGLNHRDFYLCHLRIGLPGEGVLPDPAAFTVFLMDLHRVQQRQVTPERWVVKDLAALLYSALYACEGYQASRSDVLRFIQSYRGMPWRQSLQRDRSFWRKVIARTVTMYRRYHGSDPHLPAYLETHNQQD